MDPVELILRISGPGGATKASPERVPGSDRGLSVATLLCGRQFAL